MTDPSQGTWGHSHLAPIHKGMLQLLLLLEGDKLWPANQMIQPEQSGKFWPVSEAHQPRKWTSWYCLHSTCIPLAFHFRGKFFLKPSPDGWLENMIFPLLSKAGELSHLQDAASVSGVSSYWHQMPENAAKSQNQNLAYFIFNKFASVL